MLHELPKYVLASGVWRKATDCNRVSPGVEARRWDSGVWAGRPEGGIRLRPHFLLQPNPVGTWDAITPFLKSLPTV
jgi:hypothetical protein